MPSTIAPQHYGQAVLNHVRSGVYPESEEIVSAELPSSALPEVSRIIEQAKEEVKVSYQRTNIRKASRQSAPDIDGWIFQAKQLRVDIQKSQDVAREIIEEARQNEDLEAQVDDASSKVDLLEGELSFNRNLGVTLERLQAVQETLQLIQRATLDDHLLEAVDLIHNVDGDIASLSTISSSTRITGVLRAKVKDLRHHVIEKLKNRWGSYITADIAAPSVQIMQRPERASSIALNPLVAALKRMNLFEDLLQSFCKDVEAVLQPRLQICPDATVGSLEINNDEIYVSGRSSDLSARTLFLDLESFISFVRDRLPPVVVEPFAALLMPRLISRLIATWLASAVPEKLNEFKDFENTMVLVEEFGNTLETQGWPGKLELKGWAQKIPNVWLRKRQEMSLTQIRFILAKGLEPIETVERVETQVLSQDDKVFVAKNGGDNWDAGWSDNEASPIIATNQSISHSAAKGEDEEDVSAWGLDDDTNSADAQCRQGQSEGADDDAAAWGWGDENDGEETSKTPEAVKRDPEKTKRKGLRDAAPQAEREVTLKETYNISSLPKEILEIINQVIYDAAQLETQEYASLPIASASLNLLSLPGLILAMYRATSYATYSKHRSGPMFLYNDSIWLSERLHQSHSGNIIASGKRIQSGTTYNLKLLEHINALESFSKRAYAKEMEAQRTVITDLLDGAQGFINCTEHPFNNGADLAIASTVDYIRQLQNQWKEVLSHSALLQSLGSLLSSVTAKMITDIEDMSDISEPESQQLTTYCNRITTLQDLFIPTPEGRDSSRSMVAIYTPHWLKFQYLANILESSLIDIKYLWTEGELGLEFDTEELVDLILALFADSPRRREAVAEIRRRRGVH